MRDDKYRQWRHRLQQRCVCRSGDGQVTQVLECQCRNPGDAGELSGDDIRMPDQQGAHALLTNDGTRVPYRHDQPACAGRVDDLTVDDTHGIPAAAPRKCRNGHQPASDHGACNESDCQRTRDRLPVTASTWREVCAGLCGGTEGACDRPCQQGECHEVDGHDLHAPSLHDELRGERSCQQAGYRVSNRRRHILVPHREHECRNGGHQQKPLECAHAAGSRTLRTPCVCSRIRTE